MALVINHNLSSLTAQRNLSNTGRSLGKAFERVSSGLRVNSAADDAAGLASPAASSAAEFTRRPEDTRSKALPKDRPVLDRFL